MFYLMMKVNVSKDVHKRLERKALRPLLCDILYSCFEKGCLTNGEKLTRQCRKLLWVLWRFFTLAWVNLKVLHRGEIKQHKHVFVLSRSFLLNRLEPQSSKVKLLLPIMPIGFVAYAFTLSWDNLCRNSCIYLVREILITRGKTEWWKLMSVATMFVLAP